MIFIGGWGMKFIFFRIFSIFLTQTVKNGQICIQTIKFEFEQTNQEATPLTTTHGPQWRALPSGQ
jgi:hypothetical protein